MKSWHFEVYNEETDCWEGTFGASDYELNMYVGKAMEAGQNFRVTYHKG